MISCVSSVLACSNLLSVFIIGVVFCTMCMWVYVVSLSVSKEYLMYFVCVLIDRLLLVSQEAALQHAVNLLSCSILTSS